MSDILSHIQAEWDKEDQKYESGGNSKNDDEESHVDGMNKWLVDNTDDIFNDIMKDQKKAPGYVLNDTQKGIMNVINGLEMDPVKKGKLLWSINGSANSGNKKPINRALSEANYLGNNKQVLITIIREHIEKLKAAKQGGFFFNKKKTRKRSKKKTKGKKKKKRKSKKRKKKIQPSYSS